MGLNVLGGRVLSRFEFDGFARAHHSSFDLVWDCLGLLSCFG